MWWCASLANGVPGLMSPEVSGSGGSCVTVGGFRLWHGPPEPAVGVRRVDAPGCCVLVVGFCAASDVELRLIAERAGCGNVEALAGVGGSCVVIAVRSDDVVMIGDVAGQRVVFYAQAPDRQVVVSSHVACVADLVGRELDRRGVVARLLVPDVADVWWTTTPWRRVRTLRPGWLLRIRRADSAVIVTPFARLPVPDRGLPAGGAALRTALQRAVRVRVSAARRPTVDLSGGLDSSTVAVLAAGLHDGLPALTVSAPGVEDAALAADVAAKVPRLRQELLHLPPSLLPYAGLDAVPVLDEPDAGVATFGRERWRLSQVAAFGSDLHLGGDGGDAVLLASPAYLADLASPRRMRWLWRHASGWARLRHHAPHTLIRTAVAASRMSYREGLRRTATSLAAGVSGSPGWPRLVMWCGVSGVATWAMPEARVMVADMLREHAAQQRMPVVPGEFGIGDTAAWLSLNAFSRSQRVYDQMASACGVNHHAPYLDDEVVRACWSVPAWVRTTPEHAKPLLAHAVSDLVPRRLTARSTKGDYTSLAYQGLRQHADTLTELFTRSRLAELGLIDETKILAELRRGIAGLPISLGAFDAVLATELWLRTSQPTANQMNQRGHYADSRNTEHDDHRTS